MAELHELTATEQAAAIREGALSPVELTEHYLERIGRLDAEVGAFVTVTPELARAQAAEAERAAREARAGGGTGELPPLHGVPVPVKDLNQVAGVPCTFGSEVFAGYVPEVDDHIVTALREGGSPMTGKTNTPEFGLPCYTENRVAPPARTPWDTSRSAGGSSGGAAAAVAAGLAPVAQASDGGGSIRIPASVCGLVGFKPSRGRVSSGPTLHDVTGLSTSGPIGRTVEDTAALLDVLAGVHPGDPFSAPSLPEGETFRGHARADRAPGRLRIAALTEPPVEGVTLHPDCAEAGRRAADLLRGLGHEVDEISIPADGTLAGAFSRTWSVMATLRPVPEEAEDRLMPLSRHLRARGREVTGQEFAGALYGLRMAGQVIADSLMAPGSGYDVLLSPTLAQPPLPVGALRNEEDPAAEFAALTHFTPFTALYNSTGQPAVSLPLHWSPEGLPIGVMLAGRYGADAPLLALSAQVEAAQPWHDRKPPVW
ncbi:amidase [Streptomyces sp. HNM0574]|uniref:amidase n=1 Tax=Streptomyces sp. HNM0574 TaxID=2714954 RepID=UPI00146E2155|nr:amidase [Streptomyces sp. HNM0574]NLU69018.1 amidase [Streptomyces sp. HNM0574]